nr:group II intron maturase-specific domain-containing protein [Clostridium transplantifaecale]
MSNQVREEKYQEFVRGWVNYFKLADMKGLLRGIDEWALPSTSISLLWHTVSKNFSKSMSTTYT